MERALEAVSVIVPTTATTERQGSLLRAIDSIRAQRGVRAIPIVVANGARCDRALLDALAGRSDIRFVYRAEGNLPAALRKGRMLVETRFFAELDDDDELLPDALAVRLQPMADPAIDVVVTNGFIRAAGRDVVNLPDIATYQADPLAALMRNLWLAPCAGLFRTSTIGPEFFDGIPAYLEWTYLAMKIALRRNVHFLGRPTFIYNASTSGSLSKSANYVLRQPAAIKAIMALNPPPPIMRQLERKHSAALHNASTWARMEGRYASAWKWHLLSLAGRGGWRYLSYTRRLLRPAPAPQLSAAMSE